VKPDVALVMIAIAAEKRDHAARAAVAPLPACDGGDLLLPADVGIS
jgi:hypothetical protein